MLLIPLRTRLLSNSNFNTPLNPLTLEILHVEYRTARLLDEDTFLGLIQGARPFVNYLNRLSADQP